MNFIFKFNNKLIKLIGLFTKTIIYNGSKLSMRLKQVSITFDDGPSVYTQECLDILSKKGVSATFFVVGNRINEYKDIVLETYHLGHEIGIHMWSHTELTTLNIFEQKQEILKTQSLLNEIGIMEVNYVRPPWGQYSWTYFIDSLRRRKKGVLWNVSCMDWLNPLPDFIITSVVERISPGSIILFHDGGDDGGGDRSNMLKALPVIIDGVVNMGYEIVPLSKLL